VGVRVSIRRTWGPGLVGDPGLEWATSCPPPRHNFTALPRIRSERPAFELHYPEMVERMRAESHTGRGHATATLSEVASNTVEPDETSGADPKSR